MSEKVAEGLVSIHPRISSGRACVDGIPTYILAGRFIGGESVKELAKDYVLPVKVIENAIRYELCKAKRLKRAAEMVRLDG